MDFVPSKGYELYQRGRALMEQGRLLEAIDAFAESAREDPHFKTLELQGECLVRLGRLREAVIPLAAAATLNRGCRAPALLSEVFLDLDRPADAAELARIALERDPANRRAQAVLSRLRKSSDDLGVP